MPSVLLRIRLAAKHNSSILCPCKVQNKYWVALHQVVIQGPRLLLTCGSAVFSMWPQKGKSMEDSLWKIFFFFFNELNLDGYT